MKHCLLSGVHLNVPGILVIPLRANGHKLCGGTLLGNAYDDVIIIAALLDFLTSVPDDKPDGVARGIYTSACFGGTIFVGAVTIADGDVRGDSDADDDGDSKDVNDNDDVDIGDNNADDDGTNAGSHPGAKSAAAVMVTLGAATPMFGNNNDEDGNWVALVVVVVVASALASRLLSLAAIALTFALRISSSRSLGVVVGASAIIGKSEEDGDVDA